MSDGVWWKDTRVLSPDESESGLPGTLTTSGIQGLELEPGVETREIQQLVALIDQKARLDPLGDMDLVMTLFQADLRHVRYSIDTPGPAPRRPQPDAPTERPEPDALRAAVRADAAGGGERQGVVELEAFDSTLYFLDKREIDYLRSEVDKQYRTDHSWNALTVLLDTLQLRVDPGVRSEAISALRAFLPYLLASGRFGSLARLTTELRTIRREADLESEHVAALDRLLGSVSGKSSLTQILHLLDDGRVTPTAEDLGLLLRQLDHTALKTVLVWSGQLRHAEAKDELSVALESFFAEWPAYLARILASDDRAVVQRGLLMAGRLKTPDLVEGVAATLARDDTTSRRLGVQVLGSIGGTPAMREVLRMLDDPEANVRKAAYQAFLTRPYRGATKRFREVLESTDLDAVGLSERKLLFSAFGAVAGPEGVAELKPMLEGKRSFGQRPSSETRACAALALEQIASRTARDALEAATESRDPLVRSAASSALRRRRE